MKEVDPKIFDGVVSINWDVTTPAFEQKFKSAYNMNSDKSSNRAYDAVYVFAQAVAKAKSKSEIPSILETTTFITPNGPFSFTKNHAAASTNIALEIVKDGKLTPYVSK